MLPRWKSYIHTASYMALPSNHPNRSLPPRLEHVERRLAKIHPRPATANRADRIRLKAGWESTYAS